MLLNKMGIHYRLVVRPRVNNKIIIDTEFKSISRVCALCSETSVRSRRFTYSISMDKMLMKNSGRHRVSYSGKGTCLKLSETWECFIFIKHFKQYALGLLDLLWPDGCVCCTSPPRVQHLCNSLSLILGESVSSLTILLTMHWDDIDTRPLPDVTSLVDWKLLNYCPDDGNGNVQCLSYFLTATF